MFHSAVRQNAGKPAELLVFQRSPHTARLILRDILERPLQPQGTGHSRMLRHVRHPLALRVVAGSRENNAHADSPEVDDRRPCVRYRARG